MACRGWFTALLPAEASALLSLPTADERVVLLDDLYREADADGRIASVDKAWDAMHRCLCGGWLDAVHGEEARRACVLGGKQLSDQSEWIISYVEPALVVRVAASIEGLRREWFAEQYFALDRNPPGEGVSRYSLEWVDPEVDVEYTWDYFGLVRDFYRTAANRGLATVFAVDQ